MSETFNVTIDELLKEDEEKFDISKINILEVLREQKEMRLKGNLFNSDTIASVDDISETANHFRLVDYMLDIARDKLTEDMIKKFHRILIGVSKIDYVVDYSAENSTETSAEFEVSDKLMVEGMWNNFEYVPEERENIKVVVTAPKFINPNIFQDKNYIHIMFYDGNFMKVLRTQIDSINNDGKIIDFDIDPEIKVYASQKNIDILKKNYEESRKDTK